MSKRMISESIIFDTDWLTEADFEGGTAVVKIDYQAYDTLKIIVAVNDNFNPALAIGGFFQEFDVYKLENFGPVYQMLLAENQVGVLIKHTKNEGYFELAFYINEVYWEDYLEGIGSIYIKGVKR